MQRHQRANSRTDVRPAGFAASLKRHPSEIHREAELPELRLPDTVGRTPPEGAAHTIQLQEDGGYSSSAFHLLDYLKEPRPRIPRTFQSTLSRRGTLESTSSKRSLKDLIPCFSRCTSRPASSAEPPASRCIGNRVGQEADNFRGAGRRNRVGIVGVTSQPGFARENGTASPPTNDYHALNTEQHRHAKNESERSGNLRFPSRAPFNPRTARLLPPSSSSGPAAVCIGGSIIATLAPCDLLIPTLIHSAP